MKKLLFSAVLFLSMLVAIAADKGKWTGYISDSKCGAEGGKEGHVDCATRCIKGGASPVLVVGKKVYKISDTKKVTEDLYGKKVTITGTLNGDTLEIETISTK